MNDLRQMASIKPIRLYLGYVTWNRNLYTTGRSWRCRATSHCQGCNRDNHRREDCRFRTHPDFNERGQWDGCLADRALQRCQKDEKEIKLTKGKRADDAVLPRRAPDAAVPAAPPRQNDADDIDGIMTVGIVMVIEEITEVVVVVESSGIKTKVRPVLPVVSLT